MASFTMKSALCGTPLAQKAPQKLAALKSLVVRASSDDASRRAFLGSMAAGAAWVLTRQAEAIDIVDDRKVKDTGYNLIYEARDLELPQSVRDGISQSRADLAGTKARLTESISRIKTRIPGSIQKGYWVEAREELRRQAGTMRFDLDTVALSLTDKAARKKAIKDSDKFFFVVETLDDALRNKNQDAATKAFENTIASLDSLYLG